jgi:hypothetical protein
MLDLSLVREQLRVRQELLKTNRKLLVEIDEQSHRRGENCLALLIQNGTIRWNADGSLKIGKPAFRPTAKLPPFRPP